MIDWQSMLSWTGCSDSGMKMFRFDFWSMETWSYKIFIFVRNWHYYLMWGSIGFRFFVLRNFFILFITSLENNLYLLRKMIYQVQQASSQCQKCSRLVKYETSSSSSEKSYEENHRIIIPIRKNKGDRRIEETLNLLQKEVEKLKKENQLKQKKIRNLQIQLNNKEIRFYPDTAKLGSIYENESTRFRHSSKSKRLRTEEYGQQYEQRQYNERSKNSKNHQSRALIEVDEIEKKIKEISESKNERIQFLQNQVAKLQAEVQQLQQKLDVQLNDNKWLTKFCLSFVAMAGQVAKIHGHTILQPTSSLRRNTKIGWKFIKAFLKQVIE